VIIENSSPEILKSIEDEEESDYGIKPIS